MCHDEFEDTKGVIRIPKSKSDRQCNGQKKKDKKTKEQTTRSNVNISGQYTVNYIESQTINNTETYFKHTDGQYTPIIIHNGAGTVYSSGPHKFTPILSGIRVTRSLD
jgi:hypothetical protein